MHRVVQARQDQVTKAERPAYQTAHPQFLGKGVTRSCARCGVHQPQNIGWKRTAWGLTAPCCLKKGAAK